METQTTIPTNSEKQPGHFFTSEQIAVYRNTAKKRWQESQTQREDRRIRAWQLAQLAASLLKKQFGATQVMVFGSVTDENCFTLWSDVDIAAWGLSSQDTFTAMGTVRELDESIELNLVDVNACQPELLQKILQEGILM